MDRTLTLLLSIFASLAGILLTWKNYRLQEKTTIFDDLAELCETYRKEIVRRTNDCERLESKLTTCNERLLEARHEAVVCEERLRIERELFEKRLYKNSREENDRE